MPDSPTPAPEGGIPDAISTAQLEALLDPMPDATNGLGIDFNQTGGICDLMIAIRSGLMDKDSACNLGQAIVAAASMANLVKTGFEQGLEKLQSDPSSDRAALVVAAAHLSMAADLADTYDRMAAFAFRGAVTASGIVPEDIPFGKVPPELLGKALVSADLLERLGMPVPRAWNAFGDVFLEGATSPDHQD